MSFSLNASSDRATLRLYRGDNHKKGPLLLCSSATPEEATTFISLMNRWTRREGADPLTNPVKYRKLVIDACTDGRICDYTDLKYEAMIALDDKGSPKISHEDFWVWMLGGIVGPDWVESFTSEMDDLRQVTALECDIVYVITQFNALNKILAFDNAKVGDEMLRHRFKNAMIPSFWSFLATRETPKGERVTRLPFSDLVEYALRDQDIWCGTFGNRDAKLASTHNNSSTYSNSNAIKRPQIDHWWLYNFWKRAIIPVLVFLKSPQ